jgi:hypothetical protein
MMSKRKTVKKADAETTAAVASGTQNQVTNVTSVDGPVTSTTPKTKNAVLIEMLKRPQGMTIAEAIDATGWQAHSVRGAIAGTIKKKLGHDVSSLKAEGTRTYRIAAEVG